MCEIFSTLNDMTISSLFNLNPLTASDLILLITAIIVWIYTRATQRANELQTSPALTLSFEDTTQHGGGNNGRVRINNIGRGPAYDIDFYPIVLLEEPRGAFTYTFHLDDRILEAGKEETLKMWVATPNGGVEASDMMRFLFRLIPQDLHTEPHKRIQTETPALFIANYKGLNGRRYHSVYRMYSVLPPVGDIVMQLLHHGSGKCGILQARWYHLIRPLIPHEGNRQPPRKSFLLNLVISLHRQIR